MTSRIVCGEWQKEGSKQLVEDFNPIHQRQGFAWSPAGQRRQEVWAGMERSRRGLVPGLSFFPLSPSREASAMLYLALSVYEGSLGD